MTVSVRLNAQDDAFIRSYAAFNNITISELMRQAVLEKIEDEYDLKAYEEAKAEFDKNPVTYSLEEVKEHLNLV